MAGLSFIDTLDFTHTAGELRIDTHAREVQIDFDGDGFADGSVRLSVDGLSLSDFIL